MRLRHVGLVWGKEMLNSLRDRRTLIIMIVVPLLLMPLLVLGPNLLRISQEENRIATSQNIVVLNGKDAAQLVQTIELTETLTIIESASPESDLSAGEIDAIVEIPSDFQTLIENEADIPEVQVRYDLSSTKSETAKEKLELIFDGYLRGIVEARMSTRNIEPSVLNPFTFTTANVAPPERVSGFYLSLLLPLFLVLWAAVGGAQTAIDVSAGEKERGTLESLLVCPPSRMSFVVGKFLTIFTVTFAATALSLGGFALSLTYGGSLFPDSQLFDVFKFAVSMDTLLMLFATTSIISAMMSALTFALYLWTRNFKEAQTYTTYLSFGVMLPAFAVSFSDVPTNLVSYLIPIYNGTAVIKELLLGDFNAMHIALTYGSSLLLAAIGLGLAARMFNNEKVLFRQ